MATINRSRNTSPYGKSKNGLSIVRNVIEFLQLFMPETLAKRVVAMVLLSAGVSASHVTELTGLCDRSTRGLLKSLQEENIESLLSIKSGSGRKSKTSGIEAEIVAEIEKGNYHTRQQIADMIEEQFHVSVSVATVGRLLKKTESKGEKPVLCQQKQMSKNNACFMRMNSTL